MPLEQVLLSELTVLNTGMAGKLAEAREDGSSAGNLGFLPARDLAWDFADHLRSLEGMSRDLALEAKDKLTGVIGRALLLAA